MYIINTYKNKIKIYMYACMCMYVYLFVYFTQNISNKISEYI